MRSVTGFVLFVTLIGMMTLFRESSGIGQIFCFKRGECPQIQRIPYDIPPVSPKRHPEREGFLKKFRSILHGGGEKESRGENKSVILTPTKPKEKVRIRGLEFIYYDLLPSDGAFVSFFGAVIICAIIGSCSSRAHTIDY